MALGIWRAGAGALFALALVFGAAAGLGRAQEGGATPPAGDAKPAAAAGESLDALKAVWTEILAKATAGDEDGVKALIEKMVMSEADLIAVFGEERGKQVAPKYADKVAKVWLGEAKNIATRVRERKYDEVEVAELASDKDSTGEDRKIVSAFKEGAPKAYSVRLKKKGEKLGLRYSPVFFLDGTWKVGTKSLSRMLGGDAKGDAKGGDKPPAGGGEKPPGEGK